jgi:hypothetical protein
MKNLIFFLFIFSNSCMFYPDAPKKKLIDYACNVYSQFGEDGIVQKIFEIIGTKSKIAVEFGAWDGFYLSNTANLWSKDLSWQAILIESDQERYKDLIKNTSNYNCKPIHAMVGIDRDNNLETILKNHGITQEIDLLSIDIDGNDYYIFESLKTMRPRLIICEHNPTIPIDMDLYTEYSMKNNFGTSVKALIRIANQKGYKLIALTVTNAFFVLEKDFEKFKEFETDPKLINVNDGYITLVSTYDGEFAFVANNKRVYFYGLRSKYKGDFCGTCYRWD